VPSWLDRGAELAGYPWATGAEMACCTLLQILPRYNKVPGWRPPVFLKQVKCLVGSKKSCHYFKITHSFKY
jgi:hypothetical protein